MRPRELIAISLLAAMGAGVALISVGHVTSVAWALTLVALGFFWVLLPALFLAVIAGDHLRSLIRSRDVSQDPSNGQMSAASR